MVINQLRPPCSVSLTLYTHTHFKLASQPICDSCKMQNANVNLNVNANHQGYQLSSQEIRFGRCILTHPIVRSPSVFSFSFSLTAQLDLTRKNITHPDHDTNPMSHFQLFPVPDGRRVIEWKDRVFVPVSDRVASLGKTRWSIGESPEM